MTTTTHEVGTTVRVPLAEILVDPNIRQNTTVPPEFLASVREHGVLEPVHAYQQDGHWHLGDGQIRFLAALAAEHTDITVLVQDPATAAADKVMRQLVLNELRNEISDADRAGAYQTLFDLGVTVDDIAQQASAKRERVEAALRVSRSRYAAEVIQNTSITLEQADAIAEFDDTPEAAEALTTTALEDPTRFPHALAALRAAREYQNARDALAVELGAKGTTVIDEPINGTHYRLEYLATAKGAKVLAPNAKGKGLCAHIDFAEKWDSDARRYMKTPAVVYYIEDPEANGFTITSAAKSAGGGLTDEQKAERKTTRENNTAWPLATEVRQAWILELLERKSYPTDLNQFIAISLAGGHPHEGYSSGVTRAMKWLDIKQELGSKGWYEELVREVEKHPGNANKVALAIALARVEEHIDAREGWRIQGQTKLARYLNALAGWGYGLSTIESSIIHNAGLKTSAAKKTKTAPRGPLGDNGTSEDPALAEDETAGDGAA